MPQALVARRGLFALANPFMFDVLVYLYESYWRPEVLPERSMLTRKLAAAGFDAGSVSDALGWLDDWSRPSRVEGGGGGHRVYLDVEVACLDADALALLWSLSQSKLITRQQEESLLDGLLLLPEGHVSEADLKVLLLMVYWACGEDPQGWLLDDGVDQHGAHFVH